MNKNRFYFVMVLLFTSLLVSNCRETDYKLNPPGNKVEGLNGTWELFSVVQVDEVDLAKSERDISEFYIGDGTTAIMVITFNSSDLTYKVTLGDIGKNYLPSSGTWEFDDNEFPKFIFLDDGEGNITTLSLQGPTRPQDQQLKFSFKRSCTIAGELTEYVGYRYEFNRK